MVFYSSSPNTLPTSINPGLDFRPAGVSMNARSVSTVLISLALSIAASAQDSATTPASSTPPAQTQGNGGQRGGGRGGWGGGMGMGRGLMGTVTEVAPDHYTIKTETGETYTIHYSANTRILKQQARGEGGQRGGGGDGGPGGGGGGNPPTPIKSTDIKVGDAVAAMGELDAIAKSIGATAVVQIDPERARQMREMQANYGKTWLMGKVTAIDGVKVTLTGVVDNTPHSFVADENTTFRKRRDPITLADIQVGDTVRVEGAIQGSDFLATTVNAMGPPPAGTPNVPRSAAPSSTPAPQ
jgi:preprotein translocase subunit YajC